MRCECLRIEADVLIKILPVSKRFAADLIQVFPNQFQVAPCSDKELVVMFHEVIDVPLTKETAVHHEAEFLHFQEVDVFQEILDGHDIQRVARHLPVVYRQT